MTGQKLRGVIPALVTPRDDAADEVDYCRLAELTRALLDAGIHGIFPASSTGEAPLLSRDQRRRVIEIVAEVVSGAAPVLGNAGAVTTAESIRLAKDAEAAGATHLAILPMHFVAVSAEELYGYFAAVADSVSLPAILYNYPGRTNGQNIPAAVAARLAQEHRVVGIKDSSGSLLNTIGYLEACPPDFSVMIGQEALFLPLLAAGGAGTICAAANIVPKRLVALYEAYRRDDRAAAQRHHRALLPLRSILARGTFPAAIKAAIAALDRPVGGPFLPVLPLDREIIEEMRPALQKIEADLTERQ